MSYLKHKPGSIEELMSNEAAKLNDNAYQDMFKKELDKAGKGIGSMTPKEKKDFFNKVDDKYKAKNEEVNEGITEPNGTISQKNKDLLKVNNYITVKGKVYVIDKVSLVSGVYTMKASDKNGKMHTISSKDVDSIEHWKKSLQVAGYNPKNEDKDVPAGSHKMPDGTIMKDKDHKKEVKEEDAYDNDRFIIKNGKATVDNSNTADKKDHVHAPDAKTALQLHKQGKKVYKETKSESLINTYESLIKTWEAASHKMPDGTMMKGAKHKDETKDEANDVDKGDEKKPVATKDAKKLADSGSKLTKVETEPNADFRN